MKFAANWYRLEFHMVTGGDPPPIPNPSVENLPFGMPQPFEMREIWTFEVDRLETLLDIIRSCPVQLTLQLSGYWSGSSLEAPGEPLFGVAMMDHVNRPIDSRDKPILLNPKP